MMHRCSRTPALALSSNIQSLPMKSPKDLADRSRNLRDPHKLKDDGLLREIFTLPLHAARFKARQILDEFPASGYITIVENWRQLPNGQIEFTVRRLPTAD